MGLMQWLKNRTKCADREDAEWDTYEQKTDNELTIFQKHCFVSLARACVDYSDLIKERRIEGSSEKYIVGTLPDSTVKYWIYNDGAEIGDRLLERWDYRTPQDLIEDFISIAKKSLHSAD